MRFYEKVPGHLHTRALLRKKCDYCDFYSLPKMGETDFDDYAENLMKEIALYKEAMRVGVSTVFSAAARPPLSARRASFKL